MNNPERFQRWPREDMPEPCWSFGSCDDQYELVGTFPRGGYLLKVTVRRSAHPGENTATVAAKTTDGGWRTLVDLNESEWAENTPAPSAAPDIEFALMIPACTLIERGTAALPE